MMRPFPLPAACGVAALAQAMAPASEKLIYNLLLHGARGDT
jgi:hypothetical protein